MFSFRYKHDTDKTMTQLRFVDDQNNNMGAINWYAVHPTSMNNTNKLVSSDNVGYAAVLLEREMDPSAMPGQGNFVGAFASANLGDASPNTAGPKCEFSGKPCDLLSSSCPSDEGHCFASGPGKDQFESCKIIATKLFEGARRILQNGAGREVVGEISFIHQFVNMSSAKANYFNPKTKEYETVSVNPFVFTIQSNSNCLFRLQVRGCLPAMGYSFAAGTTDGPGAFDFTQGTTTDNPLWNTVRDFLASPTPEDIQCQAPKPILLATGRVKFPFAWQPKVVPTQLLQIGNVVIAALPGEFTTMSGRRVRNVIRDSALQSGVSGDIHVITAGLSNIYTSYVATPEEYQVQRYEAASTIYGPHTLTLYLNQFEKLMQAMAANESVEPGPTPQTLDDKVIVLTPPVFFDGAPFNRRFGDVVVQALHEYTAGSRVNVQFVSGNPRNNLQHDRTYLTVERQDSNGNWTVVATDASWETS